MANEVKSKGDLLESLYHGTGASRGRRMLHGDTRSTN